MIKICSLIAGILLLILFSKNIYSQNEYLTQEGDSLWNISILFYGSPYYWVAIWDANKNSVLPDPNIVPAGVYLIIPELTKAQLKEAELKIKKEIRIGTQTWSTENLDVSTFRNGDTIPEANTDSAWRKAENGQKPAWCYYDNDPANGKTYGKLYNWYAVNDPRGLAPNGWHIPSDQEWTTLTDYLGGENTNVAGTKMKSTSRWGNWGGTNTSGFSGLPGGYRCNQTILSFRPFCGIGNDGCWWSSTEEFALYHFLSIDEYGDVWRYFSYKQDGFSVRCLRD